MGTSMLDAFGFWWAMKEKLQVALQMIEVLAHDLGTFLGLRKHEGALQNRLNEVTHGLGAPSSFWRIELLGRFEVRNECGDVPGQSAITGSPDVGVRGIRFLHQCSEQAGVVLQLADQYRASKLEIAD